MILFWRVAKTISKNKVYFFKPPCKFSFYYIDKTRSPFSTVYKSGKWRHRYILTSKDTVCHLGPRYSFVWVLRTVYFPEKRPCLDNGVEYLKYNYYTAPATVPDKTSIFTVVMFIGCHFQFLRLRNIGNRRLLLACESIAFRERSQNSKTHRIPVFIIHQIFLLARDWWSRDTWPKQLSVHISSPKGVYCLFIDAERLLRRPGLSMYTLSDVEVTAHDQINGTWHSSTREISCSKSMRMHESWSESAWEFAMRVTAIRSFAHPSSFDRGQNAWHIRCCSILVFVVTSPKQ